MCNTTCNNHSHEEYNVDYIENEQTLDITTENVPCSHEQNIYIVQDTEDEDQCNCDKCSKCEPKKVSCRSLACQQLNDECSCKRKKKKIRKTTMVNVLENNVIRLEDKMKDGCAEMHESIEDLEHNINKVYNELKDEEARAKLQEAFLHYGLDDAVTYVEYHADDRLMHFYHENPANCLNVNVHEGCDCDCCNACGCDCNCNFDECQSDIPYTMDENCNIIPMKRERVELFTLDCRDFIRDVFVRSARLEYEYPGAVDGNEGDGPWLVISFKRKFESDLANDDQNADPVDDLWIDLSKIWKLENYYDKEETRGEIKKLRIENTLNELGQNSTTDVANLYYRDLNGDVLLGTVKVKLGDITSGIQDQITNLGNTINNLNIPNETTVDNKNVTLRYGQTDTVATVNGTDITVTMPAEPSPGTPSSNVTIQNTTLQWGSAVEYGTINGSPVTITLPQAPATPQGGITFAVTDVTYNSTTNQLTITYSDGTSKPIQLSGGDCLWKRTSNDDGLEPVAANSKVYGYGFYDTEVN